MKKTYTFTHSQLIEFLQSYAYIDPNALSVSVTWYHYLTGRLGGPCVTYSTDTRIRLNGSLSPINKDARKGYPLIKRGGYYTKTGLNPHGICEQIMNAPEVDVRITPYVSSITHKRRTAITINYFDYN